MGKKNKSKAKSKKTKNNKKNQQAPASKKQQKTTEKLNIEKKRIFGGILSLIMIALLIWVGIFLFYKAFRPLPIAKILPSSTTILTFEFNTNYEHLQNIKAFRLLQKYPEYSSDNVINLITDYFHINQQNIGRNAGLALMEIENAPGPNVLYFTELLGISNKIEEFRGESETELYKNHEIYFRNPDPSIPKANLPPKYFLIKGNYLFASPDREVLTLLVDSFNSNVKKLDDSESYRRITDNLPLQRIGYLYVDFSKLFNNFSSYLVNVSPQINLEELNPLKKFLTAEGIALIAREDKFIIQSFLSLSTDHLSGNKFIAHENKYNADLLELINEDVLAFWGGQNLEYQFSRLEEAFNTKIFKEAVGFYKDKYFGSEVDLNKDILHLLKGEYMLSIEENNGQGVYTFLFKTEKPRQTLSALHILADAFASRIAVYEPKTVEYVLPDGTPSREIIAVAQNVSKKESVFMNTDIYKLELGEQQLDISYTVKNNIAIISTHITGIENAILTMEEKIPSVKTSNSYKNLILPVINSSDELSYFNLKKLLPILIGSERIPVYLKPLSAFSSGKNYFNDGIVNINFLSIE